MDDKLIDQINQFTRPDSILVSTKSKGLIRLYTPFTVKVIRSVATYMIGEKLEVVNVKVSKDLKLVYIINGKGYYHYYFSIQV